MRGRIIELVKEAYYISEDIRSLQTRLEDSFHEVDKLLLGSQDADEKQVPFIVSECKRWMEQSESLYTDVIRKKEKLSKTMHFIFEERSEIWVDFLYRIEIPDEKDDESYSSCYEAEHSGRYEMQRLKEMIECLKMWDEKYESMSSRACTKLREMKKQINGLLAKSEQKSLERKQKRLADEEQRKQELEEAKKHVYYLE